MKNHKTNGRTLDLRREMIEIANLEEAKVKFDQTGTATVIRGRRFGISVKDEGDFMSVRFGPRDLAPIGSFPTGERNFSAKQEAFDFVWL